MDIIDVILGRALTPQGQIETYATMAQTAVTNATAAVNNIETITAQTTANSEAAAQALEDANAALKAVQDALEAIEESDANIPAIDNEIDKLVLSMSTSTTNTQISKNLITTYPSGDASTLQNVLIMYQQSGNNTDGTMTQKAITNYVTNVRAELIAMIGSGGSGGGGGTSNLGPENAGNIVVVGEDGYIIPGSASEDDIIEALIKTDTYSRDGVIGLDMDFENKIYVRTQDGQHLTPGASFNTYSMFGGRMRCNVADNGTITAWYGDNNFAEDGSNGQIMVYQPKFYYQRTPINITNTANGKIVRRESLIISDEKLAGYKLHPLFINEDGEEVDYVLLPAYEACIYDTSNSAYFTHDESEVNFSEDKLSSIAGVKPASGINKAFNLMSAEQLAQNRGEGWHITNARVDSANQMLFMTEYGSPNAQVSLELGICDITAAVYGHNCSSITGSTSSLGNASGSAASTVNEINGTYTTYNEAGKKAISYRGMENIWGNMWHMVGGALLYGNRNSRGGTPYMCINYEYSNVITNNYESIGFNLPVSESFISAFGYGNDKYDWVYMPIECSSSANNVLPIGDCLYSLSQLDGTYALMNGGQYVQKEKDGLFCYAGDIPPTQAGRSYGASLMFVPTKNTIYENNITSWETKVGG